MVIHGRKMSKTVGLHYFKLIYRSVLFISAAIVYLYNRLNNTGSFFSGFEKDTILLGIIWIVFVAGMIMRFFPMKLESMGCQKQFKKNYKPINTDIYKHPTKSMIQSGMITFAIFSAWIALNACAGILYLLNIIDMGILLLLCIAFSVCDVICILFFCPFQMWFMKNKCCVTCRIYNWDYVMMFTPLVFVPSFYTWSLLGIAIALLLRWEITYLLHPERFSEKTNESLACKNCYEKLCHHKTQLLQRIEKIDKLDKLNKQIDNLLK